MKILLIIAFLVTLFTVSYYTNIYIKNKYLYSIFSVGGMAVSFLGVVAAVFSYGYIHTHPVVAVILAILAVGAYVFMFIHDYKRTSIWVALTAFILRLTIVVVVVVIILVFSMGKSKQNETNERLANIEHELKK